MVLTTESVSPEREAANEIADVIFRIGRECGRPLVLTAEDRDEIAGIVRKAGEPLWAALWLLREGSTDAYKTGRVDALAFVHAGNVLDL